MGAADVVPGVSGGTIALISGIYEELINSLKSVNKELLQKIIKGNVSGAWAHINGHFLVALFLGIGISIVSLSKVITYLLEVYPVFIWSFFFGLIVASALVISQQVTKWDIKSFSGLVLSALVAYFVTIASPAETSDALWFVFLSGTIAICAMILPGISGSFILLLLGKYNYILSSITELNFKVILTFGLGCIVGLLSFSHVLSWMFKRFHNLTIATLTGFMIGSLNKVWPWKNVLEWRTNSHGKSVPFIDESVLPADFSGDPQIFAAIAIAVVGFALILLLERLGNQKAN